MMTNYTDMWVSIQIGDTPEGTKGIGVQDYVYGVNVFGCQGQFKIVGIRQSKNVGFGQFN